MFELVKLLTPNNYFRLLTVFRFCVYSKEGEEVGEQEGEAESETQNPPELRREEKG